MNLPVVGDPLPLPDIPPLTVALPTCNGARHVAEALRGILAQTDGAFDLVVSDDRSDDDTLAIVRAEGGDRVRIAVNAERLGLAGNWNRCAALSRTQFVAIFHQDDVMRPGHLAAHRAAFLSDDRIGMVASAADVIDDGGQPVAASVVERGGLGPFDRTFGPGEALRELAVANSLRCSGVTLRAAALFDVGGFDPSWRYVVDWDCWLRIARRWKLAWLAQPTVAIRWHLASETHRFKPGMLDLEETARLQQLLLSDSGSLWPDAGHLRRSANRRLARAFLNRAYDTRRAGDPVLSWACLRRAIALWPGIMVQVLADPRLTALLALGPRAPRS